MGRMKELYMELGELKAKELELGCLAHGIYGQVDELRQMTNDLTDKIQDMVVDLCIIKNLSKELHGDEDYIFENVIEDYIGWCSDFEDLRRYIEEHELNI